MFTRVPVLHLPPSDAGLSLGVLQADSWGLQGPCLPAPEATVGRGGAAATGCRRSSVLRLLPPRRQSASLRAYMPLTGLGSPPRCGLQPQKPHSPLEAAPRAGSSSEASG